LRPKIAFRGKEGGRRREEAMNAGDATRETYK
jgi:hypothetical protein